MAKSVGFLASHAKFLEVMARPSECTMAGGRFLCALHPSMRAGWAPAWARLLKPGGELITLMFPLPPAPGTAADTAGGGKGGETKEEGPPWPLTPQLYRELLLPNGALLLKL